MKRRDLILGGVALSASAAGAASPALAQTQNLTAAQIRRIHRQRLQMARETFSQRPPLSRNGINAALDELASSRIISGTERRTLGTIVDHLFDASNIDVLRSRIARTDTSTLRDAAEVIAEVAKDSADYAGGTGGDYRSLRTAIAHDVQGAIQGAATGAEVARILRVPALAVFGVVIGALCGGASASVIGYHEG